MFFSDTLLADAALRGRIAMAALSDALGVPVVVENKPGAGGKIAVDYMLAQPRDGYTLLDANIGNALNDLLRPGAGPKMHDAPALKSAA